VAILNVDPFADWTPHAKQIEVMECPARNVVMNCGRRGGKTNVGARKFFDNILADLEIGKGLPYKPPKNRKKVKKPKPRLEYWCVAPDYNMSEIQQEELSLVIPEDMIEDWNASGNFIWLKGYILIRFKSADNPKKLVGRGLDGVWLDEASKMKPETWSGYLSYALADKGGWTIWTTTPEGINWFAEDIVLKGQFIDAGLEDDQYQNDPEWRNFYWTSIDNPIPELQKNIKKMIETYPDRYVKREIFAKFNVFHGQVYEEFNRQVHLIKRADLPPMEYYFAGGDHGWNDPAVTLTIGKCGKDYYIVKERYQREKNVLVVSDIGKLEDCLVRDYLEDHNKYKYLNMWFDPSQPEVIKTYKRYRLPARGADNSMFLGIRSVASLLMVKNDGKPNLFIVAEDCPNTIKEFEAYRWKENRDGQTTEEPIDKNNHAMDSLRYAIFNQVEKNVAAVSSTRPRGW
jgi:hypothetical protein